MDDHRTGHPYHMYDEMFAQTQVAADALAAESDQRDHLAKEMAGTHTTTENTIGPGFIMPSFFGQGRVWLTGCGTAHHAALTGTWWLRLLTLGIVDARAAQAFEYAHDPLERPRQHDVLLALSHSGEASATVDAAARARRDGVFTIALTAHPAGRVAQNCDETLISMTAPASAATYTVSHIAMLTVLADLADRTAGHIRKATEAASEAREAIRQIPDLIAAALATEARVRPIVDALGGINQVIFAGGGPNWYTAQEGALKVREAAYVSATGMQMEEVLHGPFASFDGATALVLIAPPGAARDRARDILRAVKPIGVTTIVLVDAADGETADLATHAIALPASPEWISAIPATVIAQLLTYWLAIARGGNPDRVRRDQEPWAEARGLYTR
jgi:glucosamine--fructose-6-phosphate aminotransferase (isomerizing)